MNRLLITSLALAALLLGACSQQDTPGAAKPSKQELSVQTVAAQAKGFTVGSMMSAHTVYVFFDPQCPHCGHLWQASTPLHNKIKFVWIPVAWINASSLPQGAALLTAANPTELMTAHEASLLAGKGGTTAPASVAPDIEQAIKANTKLLNSFGAESVPFIVTKDARTGQAVGRDGAIGTPELAALAGVDATP
nr:thioredoxin fold domain-containing protein [Rhodoferax sp.]